MSEVKKDGGPAFPTLRFDNAMRPEPVGYHGLTMRDWFAGQMLPRIGAGWPNDQNKSLLAQRCYEIADAMLAERSK